MACLTIGMIVGLVLGQGENDEGNADNERINDAGRLENTSAGSSGERTSSISSTSAILGWRGVLDVLVPTPTPLPDVPELAAPIEEAVSRDVVGDGQRSGRIIFYTALGEIVAAYDWPIKEAFAVVDCESSWNPLAVSWAGSRGLMQLMPVHAWRFAARGWDYWSQWMIPEINVAIAYELWLEQGWAPWTCA